MKPVWEVLHPYPEVAQGRVTEDSFVVTLGGIWERLELGTKTEVDPRYLDPEGFYRRTHFTDAMKTLLINILERLRGEPAQSVYHLQVGMGGGKSHTLLLLYYLSKHPEKALLFLKREGIANEVPHFKVAVLDGFRLSPTFGMPFPDGTRVQTLWGLLFKQLGVYNKFKETDRWEESPSVPMLKEAFGGRPTLILIDELTSYLASVLGKTRLSDRAQAFLQALTTAVKETPGCALVVTTPIGIYEEGRKLVSEILSRFCTPTVLAVSKEYKSIRRRALYTDDFDALAPEVEAHAREYESTYKLYIPGRSATAVEAITDNYPFHPFVDSTLQRLKENKAFQEVRDELRFLVGLIYSVHLTRDPEATLISVGHARLEEQYVRGGTISKLRDPILVARLDTELEQRLKEVPEEIRETAKKVLAVIVLNSLTGERPLERGVTEEEAKYALLTPGSSPAMIEQALRQIMKSLWFIDFINERYVFGRPNINKLIDDYVRKVERDLTHRGLWWNKITGELIKWKEDAIKRYVRQAREKGRTPLFKSDDIQVWVNRSGDIHDDTSIKLIFSDYTLPPSKVIPEDVLAPEEKEIHFKARVASSPVEACEAVKDLYETYGEKPRDFKNTVYFLVAGRDLVEKNGPVEHAKQSMALDEMLKDRDELRTLIGESGLSTIEKLKADTLKDLLPSCARVYQYLVYPSEGGLTSIQLGEERMDVENLLTLVEEKLKSQAKKVLDRIDVNSLLDRYWPKAKERIEVRELVNGFYRRPEIEIITDRSTVEDTIREALKQGLIAYSYGSQIFFHKEPLRIEDDGVLVKNPEIAEVSVEAVDEEETPLNVRVHIDGKEEKLTPTMITDLKGATHKIKPVIPDGMISLGWRDGSKEDERLITWDQNKSLTFICTPEELPPLGEVEFTIKAADVKSNDPLGVTVVIDGLTYKTPIRLTLPKDKRCMVHVETPKEMTFEGWSDGISLADREVLCDVDQVITAKFRAVTAGTEIIKRSGPVEEGLTDLKSLLDRKAKSITLDFASDYGSISKHLGAMMQLLADPFIIKINASGGKSLGLDKLSITASAKSEKQSELKSCLTQLREYIEETELTLNKEMKDYTLLRETMNGDAIDALKKMEGTVNFEISALAEPKSAAPTRTLQGILKEFKRGV